MTNRRYIVFALMFLSVFVSYMDRVNYNLSIPSIRAEFGFGLQTIGWISFAWAMAYAIFNFPGGLLVDRLGLRKALPLTLGWWSLFTIGTPLAGSFVGWCVIRALMGAGEAPIWPINAKCANTWAAPGERSTLYTLAGSGQYLGPAIGTLLAGYILVQFGWRWTFVAFGLAGLAIVPLWIYFVRDRPALDPHVGAQELAKIENRAPLDEKPDWPGIRDVVFSRTGLGMLLIYITFGYILFTFLNWMPSYIFYTFHSNILKTAEWATLTALLGWVGFVASGFFNDALAARMDRLTARRIGTAAPMLLGALCVFLSLGSAHAGQLAVTAVFLGFAQLLMNMTVGAWAVNVIDISPNQASTGFVYGIYNGALNIMGACNSIILTWLAVRYGFPVAFGSAIAFMLVFVIAILFVVDRKSYTKLIARAQKLAHGSRCVALARWRTGDCFGKISATGGFTMDQPRKELTREQALKQLVVLPALAGIIAAGFGAPAQADSRKTLQYQSKPGPAGAECSQCSYFKAPHSCSVITGVISPSGWCRAWHKK